MGGENCADGADGVDGSDGADGSDSAADERAEVLRGAGVSGDMAAAAAWAGHRPGSQPVGAREGPAIGRGQDASAWLR